MIDCKMSVALVVATFIGVPFASSAQDIQRFPIELSCTEASIYLEELANIENPTKEITPEAREILAFFGGANIGHSMFRGAIKMAPYAIHVCASEPDKTILQIAIELDRAVRAEDRNFKYFDYFPELQ